MKNIIDDAEIYLVQDLIISCNDDINNNEVLWNEVSSLNLILEEIMMVDDVLPSIDEELANIKSYENKTFDFIQWQCNEHLKQIQELLGSIEEDGEVQFLLTESYPNINRLLLHYNAEQHLGEEMDPCHWQEEKEDDLKNTDTSYTKKDYFEMIGMIRDNLNCNEVMKYMDVIHEAFKLEAEFLLEEANRIRSQIDVKSNRNSIHLEKAHATHYDKRALSEMKKVKRKLETTITLKKRSDDIGKVIYRNLPPLQENIQPQSNHARHDNGKENSDPVITRHSKKRIQLQNALDKAANLQSEFGVSP